MRLSHERSITAISHTQHCRSDCLVVLSKIETAATTSLGVTREMFCKAGATRNADWKAEEHEAMFLHIRSKVQR